jgi:hypothetical protein
VVETGPVIAVPVVTVPTEHSKSALSEHTCRRLWLQLHKVRATSSVIVRVNPADGTTQCHIHSLVKAMSVISLAVIACSHAVQQKQQNSSRTSAVTGVEVRLRSRPPSEGGNRGLLQHAHSPSLLYPYLS